MLKKQDRTPVRKATDVEQKYNLTQLDGGNASVVAARRAAQQAEAAAQTLIALLGQEYIISYLTNNGEAKALYLRDGQIYIDGKYVEGGGINGFSPTIEVSPITGGYRLTITDANGTKTVDIMNGAAEDVANLAAQVLVNETNISTNAERIQQVNIAYNDAIANIEGGDSYDNLAVLTEKVALNTAYISQNIENIAQNDNRIKQINSAFNEAIADIEGEGDYDNLTVLTEKVATNKSDISNLKSKVSDNEGNIRQINIAYNEAIGNIEGGDSYDNLTVLTEKVGNHGTNIATNSERIQQINKAYNEAIADIEGGDSYDNLTVLTEKVATNKTDISTLKGKVATNEANIATNSERIMQINKAYNDAIADIEGGDSYDNLTVLTEKVATNEGKIKTNENRIANIASSLGDSIANIEGGDVYDNLTVLTEKTGTNAAEIAKNTNLIQQINKAYNDAIANIEGGDSYDNLTSLTERVDALEQGNDLEARVAANEEDIAQNKNWIQQINTAYNDAVANLEGMISDLQMQIEYLEQRISDLEDA